MFQNFVKKHEGCSYSTVFNDRRGGDILCDEKKEDRKYYYKYKTGETFLRIVVDGGLIKDEDNPKCDYLLLNTTEKWIETNKPNFHAIFIELKGKNIFKARKQLLATIDKYDSELLGAKLHARIVASEVHIKKGAPLNRFERYKTKSNNTVIIKPASSEMTEHTGKNGNPTRK